MKISKMLRSFKFALAGMVHLVRFENNAQFHFLASLLVVFVGYWLKIDKNEWIIIIFAMALVWSAEAFNSAIEKLCGYSSLKKTYPLTAIMPPKIFGYLQRKSKFSKI